MSRTDIILLGHGSRRGSDTDEGLRDATARLQALAGPSRRVRMAAFEFTEPNIPDAVAGLVAEGSRRIAIVPFFLFDGKHVTVEIPEELDKVRARYPGLDLVYARTLGVDSRLVELVFERVHQAVAGGLCGMPSCTCLGAAADLGAVFVNRGSHFEYDDGARLRELAQLVSGKIGAPVAPAQAEYESPTILEAVAGLVERGARRVAVVPYIFFPGKVLSVNILPAVQQAWERYPHVDFRVAPTLGVDDRLIDLAWQRAREAMGELVPSPSP